MKSLNTHFIGQDFTSTDANEFVLLNDNFEMLLPR